MRRKLLLGSIVVVATGAFVCFRAPTPPRLVFPGGKAFAFSIIDDTDMTTLARARPVYATLQKYGLRTTKTVWVLKSNDESHTPNRGDSLRDPDYRQFVLDLHRRGFEIALHGARGGSSRRDDVVRALDEFKRELGHDPRMHVNHSLNKDNLYWGRHLFAFAPLRWAAGLKMRHEFSGHDPASPYFWGDVAQQRIRYVRRFTFADINLLAVNPSFPYRLAEKPYVNYWFPTALGDRVVDFHQLLKPENLDKLEREGGVCLVYAHLGSGSFNNKDGGVDQRFETRVREVGARNGWFVPASDILDYLTRQASWTGNMSVREQMRVDAKYLASQLLPASLR